MSAIDPFKPEQLLQRERAQAAQRLAQLEQIQSQRLGMLFADLVNAATMLVSRAESGDPQARALVKLWVDTQDRARAIAGGIEVARKL